MIGFEGLGVIGEWATAAISLVGVVVTLFVLFEAKKIRKSEYFFKIYEMWERFNVFELESGFVDRWGEFYDLKFDDDEFSATDMLVFFNLANILQISWTAAREGILHSSYAKRQLFNHIRLLKPKRDFFMKALQDYGYDEGFISTFGDVTGDNERQALKAFKASLK